MIHLCLLCAFLLQATAALSAASYKIGDDHARNGAAAAADLPPRASPLALSPRRQPETPAACSSNSAPALRDRAYGSTAHTGARGSAFLRDASPGNQHLNATTTTMIRVGWPTLREMIAADARLVAFIASTAPDAAHPHLLSAEFDHGLETAWEVTAPATGGFNCTIDRPARFPSAGGLLPRLNHFAHQDLGSGSGSGIRIPDAEGAPAVESPSESEAQALGRLHARGCRAGRGGAVPAFVLVGSGDQGPSIETADALDGVAAPVGRVQQNSTRATTGDGTSADSEDGNTGEAGGTAAGGDAGGSTGSKVGGAGTGALVAFIVGALLLVR